MIIRLEECIALPDPGDEGYLFSTAKSILATVSPCLLVESLSLLLYDGPRQHLSLYAMTGVGPIDLGQEWSEPGKHLTGAAFALGTTLCSNDLRGDDRADKKQALYWESHLTSRRLEHGVFVPFSGMLECRGVIRAFNRLDHQGSVDATGFSEEDIAVFEEVAKVVGYFFGSAWEKRSFHLFAHDFSPIPTKVDVREMCGLVARAAAVVANCAAAALYIIDAADTDFLRLAGSWGFSRPYPAMNRFPAEGSAAGRVARSGKSEVISDLLNAPGIANRDVGVREQLLSCAAVPVFGSPTASSADAARFGSEDLAIVRGCLVVFARDKREFQKKTVDILESLGLYAGSLLQARTASIQAENLRGVLQLVGHSVRTPLAEINSIADDLRFEVGASVEDHGKALALSHLIKKLQTAKDLAAARVDSLLFSKRNILDVMGIDRKPVDLSQVLIACKERHQSAATGRSVEIEIKDSVRRLPLVRCDHDKIDLVFDNLLENAVKYSWRNESVEITAWHSEKEVRIFVSDKGLGIHEKNHAMIFDAFNRSEVLDSTRYIKGTGLGLQLVKLVVEAHQGKVGVSSKPFLSDPKRLEKLEGFETVFTVTLPR
jgi:signal transduction histidine kinase